MAAGSSLHMRLFLELVAPRAVQLRWTGTCLRSVRPADIIQNVLALSVHQPRECLLRVPEDEGPSEDLR